MPDNGARLSYRADQDAYAYLLRQDRDGKFSLLYSGGIEAGKTYYYPGQDQLPKSDATGTKTTVFLVASPTPVTDLETRLKELERPGKDQMQTLFPRQPSARSPSGCLNSRFLQSPSQTIFLHHSYLLALHLPNMFPKNNLKICHLLIPVVDLENKGRWFPKFSSSEVK